MFTTTYYDAVLTLTAHNGRRLAVRASQVVAIAQGWEDGVVKPDRCGLTLANGENWSVRGSFEELFGLIYGENKG